MGIFNYKEKFESLINRGNKSVIKEEDTSTVPPLRIIPYVEKEQVITTIIEHEQREEDDEIASKKFFSKIYGQDDIKLNLYSAVTSKEQINSLLYGPPACSKSLFMKIIEEKTNDCFYFDCSQATSAGLIEALNEHRDAKILCLDEIGMLKKNDLDALRGLLNDGRIIKTLKKKRYDFTMNVKIFATTNDMNLPNPIISRFTTYQIPDYSDEDFIKVVQFCLRDKYNDDMSALIANVFLSHKLKDVRQVINASRLIKNKDSETLLIKKIETIINRKVTHKEDYN